MRVMTLAAVATLTLAAPALAQGPRRDPLPGFAITPMGSAITPIGPAITPIGSAIGPIGLPLPPIGLQPPAGPVHATRQRGRLPRENGFFSWPMMVFYMPQPAGAAAPTPVSAPRPAEPPAPGRLILEIEPAGAQVFADGYYVGVPEDFSATRGGGVLEAGLHRIDVSATGYESLAVDLRVTSGQPVTYRAALKALPPLMSAPPSTFYLIPGCYMGNIPPKDAHLPATCDQSRAVVWRP
jgi:hypothetical protein